MDNDDDGDDGNEALYYTVIKHNRHSRTQGKCRKHKPQGSLFYISQVFSNVQNVLSQCTM